MEVNGIRMNPFVIFNQLTFGSTQVANAAGVTSRQLRYWETQGYIEALPEKANNARQYSVGNAIKVISIKQGLDSGLKLADAAKAAGDIIDQTNYLGTLMGSTYLGYQKAADHVALQFGPLEGNSDGQLTGIIKQDRTYFKITKKRL